MTEEELRIKRKKEADEEEDLQRRNRDIFNQTIYNHNSYSSNNDNCSNSSDSSSFSSCSND